MWIAGHPLLFYYLTFFPPSRFSTPLPLFGRHAADSLSFPAPPILLSRAIKSPYSCRFPNFFPLLLRRRHRIIEHEALMCRMKLYFCTLFFSSHPPPSFYHSPRSSTASPSSCEAFPFFCCRFSFPSFSSLGTFSSLFSVRGGSSHFFPHFSHSPLK